MNSASTASNLFEVFSQTISTWNNASVIIDYFEQLEIERKANKQIEMQFDTIFPTPNGQATGLTPIYYFPDSIKLRYFQHKKKRLNDSMRKANPIKSR